MLGAPRVLGICTSIPHNYQRFILMVFTSIFSTPDGAVMGHLVAVAVTQGLQF